MHFRVVLLLLTLSSLSRVQAQNLNNSFGLGLGLEYGGIGGQVVVKTSKSLAIFGGIGTALADVGYNVGMRYFFKSKGSEQFFLHGMYGYNAVIIVKGLPSVDEVYYGPSVGVGLNVSSKNDTFWEFALSIPFRSSEFRDDWNALDNDPNIEISQLLPFTVSIGYNFRF